MNYILGLDLSTTCVGYCLISEEGKVELAKYTKLSSKKTLFERACIMEDKLNILFDQYDISNIYIEKILLNHIKTSKETIVKLASFNGIISHFIYKKNRNVEHLPAVTARRLVGIKQKVGFSGKQLAAHYVLENEPDFPMPVVLGKKTGKPPAGPMDAIDAYIVAKAGWFKLTQNVK